MGVDTGERISFWSVIYIGNHCLGQPKEFVKLYLGKRKTAEARHPQSALPPSGAARLIRGPIAS